MRDLCWNAFWCHNNPPKKVCDFLLGWRALQATLFLWSGSIPRIMHLLTIRVIPTWIKMFYASASWNPPHWIESASSWVCRCNYCGIGENFKSGDLKPRFFHGVLSVQGSATKRLTQGVAVLCESPVLGANWAFYCSSCSLRWITRFSHGVLASFPGLSNKYSLRMVNLWAQEWSLWPSP